MIRWHQKRQILFSPSILPRRSPWCLAAPEVKRLKARRAIEVQQLEQPRTVTSGSAGKQPSNMSLHHGRRQYSPPNPQNSAATHETTRQTMYTPPSRFPKPACARLLEDLRQVQGRIPPTRRLATLIPKTKTTWQSNTRDLLDTCWVGTAQNNGTWVPSWNIRMGKHEGCVTVSTCVFVFMSVFILYL